MFWQSDGGNSAHLNCKIPGNVKMIWAKSKLSCKGHSCDKWDLLQPHTAWLHIPHLSLQHWHFSNWIALGTGMATGKVSDEISSTAKPVVTSCKWRSCERKRQRVGEMVILQQPPFKSDTVGPQIKKTASWLLRANKEVAYLEGSVHWKASVCDYN